MAAKFQIYEDASGKWRWRLKAANGVMIASSGEAFDSKSNAKRAAENVKATVPTAEIDDGNDAAMRAALLDALIGRRQRTW